MNHQFLFRERRLAKKTRDKRHDVARALKAEGVILDQSLEHKKSYARKANFKMYDAVMIRTGLERDLKTLWSTPKSNLEKYAESLDLIDKGLEDIDNLNPHWGRDMDRYWDDDEGYDNEGYDEVGCYALNAPRWDYQRERLYFDSKRFIDTMFVKQASVFELLAAKLGLSVKIEGKTIRVESLSARREKQDPERFRINIPAKTITAAWTEQVNTAVNLISDWLSLEINEWRLLLQCVGLTEGSTLTCNQCAVFMQGKPFSNHDLPHYTKVGILTVEEATELDLDQLRNNLPSVIEVPCWWGAYPGIVKATNDCYALIVVDTQEQIKGAQQYLHLLSTRRGKVPEGFSTVSTNDLYVKV